MAQRSDSRTAAAVGTAAAVHQAGQAVLARDLVQAVGKFAWPEFDPTDIRGTLPRLVAVIMALIQRYGAASAVHAGQFYQAQRVAAGIPGRHPVPVAEMPSAEQVSKSLEWATSNLYGAVTPETEQAALTNVEGLTQTMVLDVGRDTILDAVAHDDKARGWARVPEAGACSFCLLLATRGAVYKTKGSFDQSNGKFIGGGEFKVHDHCACHLEPQFSNHYEPTAEVRAAQELYRNTPYGSTPAETRNNFRVALQRERDAGRF